MNSSARDEFVSINSPSTHHESSDAVTRKPWVSPGVTVLPRLSEITLQSPGPIPGGGGTGGGGSTVIP
jgi:hypothetical protein